MGQPVSPVLNKCLTILDPVVKTIPGLLQGHYYMAKVKFIMGELIFSSYALLLNCFGCSRIISIQNL